jgi:parallel beta-helix repeat protein
VKTTDGYRVHNVNTGLDYVTIQEAVNASETLNGHTIYVEAGIYYEHIVLAKSLSLVGENRSSTTVDGNSTGTVVLITAANAIVRGFTVRRGEVGVYLDHSNNSLIAETNLNDNADALIVSYSGNCTVRQNVVENNSHRGILATNSWNSTVGGNYLYRSGWYGINSNSSANSLVEKNSVLECYYDGIGLADSSNCTVVGNSVENNTVFGIWVDSSSGNNTIYHNNIINNGIQATVFLATNRWDNGFEGNYWSNYTGTDFFHGSYQNETGSDGIGDSPHVINEANKDNSPLMGRFSEFEAIAGLGKTFTVSVITNSTVSNLTMATWLSSPNQYLQPGQAFLQFFVAGENQTIGFSRLAVPKEVINGTHTVLVDWTEVPVDKLVVPDAEHTYLYFTYQHTEHEVIVIPEFSFTIILFSLAMVAQLITVIYWKKHGHKHRDQAVKHG